MSRTPSSYGTVFGAGNRIRKPSAIDRSSLVLFRGGLCSIGRVAHFNGRSICFSTSLQIFVGKIAGPLLEPFRDPKSGPARNHKQKLYIYFCGAISGAVKTDPFLGPPFGQTFAVTSFILVAWHQKKLNETNIQTS